MLAYTKTIKENDTGITCKNGNPDTCHHSEGLSRACLTIGKDSAVVTSSDVYNKENSCQDTMCLKDRVCKVSTVNDALDGVLKDILLRSVHAKHLVERETALEVFALFNGSIRAWSQRKDDEWGRGWFTLRAT